jgi:hypothetical protein
VFTFKVTPDGGGDPYEVTADSRDVARWERTGKGRSMQRLRDTMSFVDLYALAHVAAVRQGLFVGSLGEFEESVVFDIKAPDDEGEDGDPTRPAR